MNMNDRTVADPAVLSPCEFCGSDDFTRLFIGHDYMSFSPLDFNVMKCGRCGLVCLNPRPENILPYYAAYRQKDSENDPFMFLCLNRKRLVKKINPPGKLLDIGCGRGGFLLEMREEGWEVYGCDTSAEACERARRSGLKNIYDRDMLSLDFPERSFDLITLWHVLEHLERPFETLKKISRLLKEDGTLIIESPDFSSWQSRFFKDKWFALDLPRHLYQFRPDILKKILAPAGLGIVKRDYIVNPRITFVSLKYSLLRYLGLQGSASAAAINEYKPIAGFRRSGVLWALSRVAFNIVCLLVSLVLVVSRREDSFRVYCQKTVRS